MDPAAKNNDREWEALLVAYRKVTDLKEYNQALLYKFAGAYLAGAVAMIAWLAKESNGQLQPLLYAAGSIVNTFYVVFYSYCSVVLMLADEFLQRLSVEAEKYVDDAARYLRWEAFSAGRQGLIRKMINRPLSAWRLVPLSLALALPVFAITSNESLPRVVGVIALLMAIAFAVPSFLGSVIYVMRQERARVVDPPEIGLRPADRGTPSQGDSGGATGSKPLA